jgi:hypothetical protein
MYILHCKNISFHRLFFFSSISAFFLYYYFIIIYKRKKSNGKKNKNQDDLTGNEPLIIVSSNDKIDDENVFIEEINQIHKKEEDVQQSNDEENDVESIENKVVQHDEDVIVQSVKKDVPVSYHSPEKPSMAQISEVEALEFLDQKKVIELKEAFTLFDLDGDGVISELDLKNTFLTFGSDVSDTYVKEMLSEVMFRLIIFICFFYYFHFPLFLGNAPNGL